MSSTPRRVPFKQVDVFTDRPFLGNPVAVVLDAEGLTTDQMQRIARWMNLSETTFVLPSAEASYRLRIFSPARELPFAGHPTIGSAHAVIEAGLASPRDGLLTQECEAGLIPIVAGPDGSLSARVPTPRVIRDGSVSAERVGRMLGAPVESLPTPSPVDVGPVWLVAHVTSLADLAAASPDLVAITEASTELGVDGITAFAIDPEATAGGARIHVRSFAPVHGIAEDPVCGSGNAAVGAFLSVSSLLARTGRAYVAAQGMQVGRDGRVAVRVIAPDHVEIGGTAVTVVDGSIRVD
jgi:PhzF family phenazine biosynthesis protein